MTFEIGSIVWNVDVNNPAGRAPNGKFEVIKKERAEWDNDKEYLRARLLVSHSDIDNDLFSESTRDFEWWLLPENCKLDFLYICSKVKKKTERRKRAARSRK